MLFNKTIGSVLLITGTCIGAGMLALPITTALAGFYWSGVLIVLAWILMTITGLYVVEVNIWLKGRASYISMAGQTLGKIGKGCTWLLFLFLLYALMAAYITGGAALLTHALSEILGREYGQWYGLIPWVAVFGVLIYLGTQVVDIINKLLVFTLTAAYIVMTILILPHAAWHPSHFPSHPLYILAALPILLTSYGYHIIIPSVSHHVSHDARKLRRIVIIGSSIAVIVYLVWVYLVLGVLPEEGEYSFQGVLMSGQPSTALTDSLYHLTGSAAVGACVELFVFCALSSSFIGVSLGLFHLLIDGVKIGHGVINKALIAILTFVPPLVFGVFYPRGFIVALGYAGVIVAIIHGILPVLMAWRGRYSLEMSPVGSYRVFGGKPLMVLVCLFSLLVIAAEIAGFKGMIPRL